MPCCLRWQPSSERRRARRRKTISAFALAYGVLQLFFGPLGDRYGKVRVIGCATLACTVGSVVAVAVAQPRLAGCQPRAVRRGGGRNHSADDGMDRRQRVLRRPPGGVGATARRDGVRHDQRPMAGRPARGHVGMAIGVRHPGSGLRWPAAHCFWLAAAGARSRLGTGPGGLVRRMRGGCRAPMGKNRPGRHGNRRSACVQRVGIHSE